MTSRRSAAVSSRHTSIREGHPEPPGPGSGFHVGSEIRYVVQLDVGVDFVYPGNSRAGVGPEGAVPLLDSLPGDKPHTRIEGVTDFPV